jgi:cytochrome c biogenesis protein CcmG, thiol:disulfide interchange protein DsbE
MRASFVAEGAVGAVPFLCAWASLAPVELLVQTQIGAELSLLARENRPMDEAVAPPGRKWGRIAIFLLPGIAFVALLVIAVLRVQGPLEIGQEAPLFSAPLLEGDGEFALADARGKPAVLNFWASWCGPCKDEAPMLKRAERIYGEQVEIIGVNTRDANSDALAFVEDEEIGELTHIVDEGERLYEDYGLTGQPETFFLDTDGTVVQHVAGPLSEDTLFSYLDALVGRDG